MAVIFIFVEYCTRSAARRCARQRSAVPVVAASCRTFRCLWNEIVLTTSRRAHYTINNADGLIFINNVLYVECCIRSSDARRARVTVDIFKIAVACLVVNSLKYTPIFVAAQ